MVVGQGELSEHSEAIYLPGMPCAFCAYIWAGSDGFHC